MVEINLINVISSSVLFLIGFPGNILILHFFITSKKNKSNHNLFLIHIAIADVLTCFVRFVAVISTTFMVNQSQITNAICRYGWSIPFIASDVSVCILCGMSFDRYLRVTRPLGQKLPQRIIHTTCCFYYSLGAFLWVYYYYWREMDTGTHFCIGANRPPNIILVSTIIVNFLLMFLLPVFLIVYMFARMSNVLKRQSRFVQQSTRQDSANHNLVALDTLKALTLLMLVTVALPKIMLPILYRSSQMGLHYEWLDLFEMCVTNLVFVNSSINVLVYLYHMKDFKNYCSNVIKKPLSICKK